MLLRKLREDLWIAVVQVAGEQLATQSADLEVRRRDRSIVLFAAVLPVLLVEVRLLGPEVTCPWQLVQQLDLVDRTFVPEQVVAFVMDEHFVVPVHPNNLD
jgi:hypothetical protein